MQEQEMQLEGLQSDVEYWESEKLRVLDDFVNGHAEDISAFEEFEKYRQEAEK